MQLPWHHGRSQGGTWAMVPKIYHFLKLPPGCNTVEWKWWRHRNETIILYLCDIHNNMRITQSFLANMVPELWATWGLPDMQHWKGSCFFYYLLEGNWRTVVYTSDYIHGVRASLLQQSLILLRSVKLLRQCFETVAYNKTNDAFSCATLLFSSLVR